MYLNQKGYLKPILFDKDYDPQHRSLNILHYNTVYISSNIIHTVGATFPQYISCFWGSISLFNISTREAYLSCHKVTSIRIIFEVFGFVEYTSTKIHCFMKVIHDSFPSHNRCCNNPKQDRNIYLLNTKALSVIHY